MPRQRISRRLAPEIGTSVKKGRCWRRLRRRAGSGARSSHRVVQAGQAEHQQSIAELEEAKSELALAEANVAGAGTWNLLQSQNLAASLWSARSISREDYDSAQRDRDARNAELASTKADVQRRKTNLQTRDSIIDSKHAMVRNREANVQRLRDLTSFQKIVAPFDGIVTRRTAEIGMLVTPGSNTGTRPLFSMAQVDILRVQATVPQSSALHMKAGDQAHVLIPEKPGQVLKGKVARTAGAVDPASRSLLVEVELPNRNGDLLPGVYAQIRFQSSKEQANWMIPAKAVLMRSNGSYVVTVSADGVVRTQKVTLGRDMGTEVEVLVGLQGDERLIVNPSDDLRDGQTVQIAETKDARAQR